MKDLSEHITDIAQNSTRAMASQIEITLAFSETTLTLDIKDNGKGMSDEMLATVSDPFTTTRTTRKVGMGIAFLKQSAEQTGGKLSIASKLGQGTTLRATFVHTHWDMLPLGDIAGTIVLLIGGNPNIDFLFTYKKHNADAFVLDTREVKSMLDDMPLSNLSIMKMLKELIVNNITDQQDNT